jgi:hypothetical protein
MSVRRLIVLAFVIVPLHSFGVANPYEGMNDYEFARLQVQLPPPKAGEWETATTTRQEALRTTQAKLAALDHIGTWIRLSLRDAPNLAPMLLDSLLVLQSDKDPIVQFKGAMELYRLGDYERRALKLMEKLVTQSAPPNLEGADLQTDRREQIFRELLLYRDHRLDDSVYAAWTRDYKPRQPSALAIQLAVYLELAGRELPDSFWIEAAEVSDREEIFDVLLKHDSTNGIPALEKILHQNHRPYTTRVRAILYLRTKDDRHWEDLVSRAQRLMQAPSADRPLQVRSLFIALADARPTASFPLLEKGVHHTNPLVRSACIYALGRVRVEQASDLLATSARSDMSSSLFPRDQLLALLHQSTERSLKEYERLKSLALDPQRGFGPPGAWMESDFAELDFCRKWGYLPRM